MAVTISDLSSEAGWSVQAGRTYTVKLQVESDSPIGGKAAIDACNLWDGTTYRFPMVDDATESDDRSFLQGVAAAHTADDHKTWAVTLSFGPLDPSQDQQKGPVDEEGVRQPFLAPPTLRTFAEVEEWAVTKDRSGEKILNSAGDPFDPPLVVEVPILTFEVGRLEREFDAALIAAVQGRVNASAWLGWPARSILCRSIAATRAWNDDVNGWAWDVTYTFAYRAPIMAGSKMIRPGWDLEVLDAGFRELSGGERAQILVDGAPVSSPVPLDGSGGRLAPDAEPVYKVVDVFPRADFATLNMPADLFTVGTPEV